MYRVEIDVEAQSELDELPPDAVVDFLELRTALETSPHTLGRLVRDTPTANMRWVPFGPADRGLVVWYTIELERRVSVVRVIWI